jgi:CHASE2 domain-containing sensor protein
MSFFTLHARMVSMQLSTQQVLLKPISIVAHIALTIAGFGWSLMIVIVATPSRYDLHDRMLQSCCALVLAAVAVLAIACGVYLNMIAITLTAPDALATLTEAQRQYRVR